MNFMLCVLFSEFVWGGGGVDKVSIVLLLLYTCPFFGGTTISICLRQRAFLDRRCCVACIIRGEVGMEGINNSLSEYHRYKT
jgi:hypothetical protein